jgi:hypothetical protein
MPDLFSEPRISINALAKRVGFHPSTCWRWCLRGVRGIVLESFNVGGKRFTTLPAYERWLTKINRKEASANPVPAYRERAVDAAERELDAILDQ